MGLMDNAKDALGQNQDKVEQASDQGLDKAADLANEKTGGEHSDQVQQGRDFLDSKMGQDGDQGDQQA